MNFQDYFVNLILSGVMIIGAYQFTFIPSATLCAKRLFGIPR